jgi:hypothetical protein
MSTVNTTNLKHGSSSSTNIELKSNGGIGNLSISNPGALNFIEVGSAQTGDYTAYIDLITDTTYNDYGLRFLRYGGANASSVINSRGTGNLALQAPDANGQIVIENFAPQIPQAYVNFDGGNTSTIYGSYNVSSVTDNGVGDYTVNYSNDIIKKDHSSQGTPAVFLQSNGPVNGAHCHTFPSDFEDGKVTVRIYKDEHSGYKADGNPVSVVVYG